MMKKAFLIILAIAIQCQTVQMDQKCKRDH